MGQRFFKVRAGTLEEAFRKMRRQLGPEAVVISTSQVSQGGLFGLFSEKLVEITASISETGAPARTPSAVERKYASQSRLESALGEKPSRKDYEELIRAAQRRMNGEEVKAAPVAERADPSASNGGAPGQAQAAPVLPFPKRMPEPEGMAQDLRRELQEIREMMQVLYAESPGAGLPGQFAPHYRTLVNRGVARKVAAALIGAVVKNSELSIIRDPRVFVERLHFEIRRMLEVSGGIALQNGACRVVALCGATGVGKTTNLAKLAAQFAVHERARVGLITADTFRVAASDQLRVYANIIGLPLRIVNEAKDMPDALGEFRGYDLVLMDTAGGSQFNLEQINELKGVLHAAQPHETILVMSANTQLEDLRNVVANFKCLRPTSVMFTKLDETRHYGALFSILLEAKLPVSYLSVGQNVPDDIRAATPGMVANMVLEGTY